MRERRCRHDIYASILAYIESVGEARVTEIARFSNLPVDRAKRYLREMAELGLIREYTNGKNTYTVTRRGFEYAALYKRIKALVG
ncbi:MAG: hypothetical protein DRN99_08770 [Thermoproteota archaeon]|nr:MAG: hypothetical protein DRN99_08770 [Candidatus Korarchaeota archaeon]